MAIAVVNSANTNFGNGVVMTTATVSLPASIVAGNVLVVALVNGNASFTASAAGWTQVAYRNANGSSTQGGLWSKVATGTEGASVNFTVSSASSFYMVGLAMQLSGSDGTLDGTPVWIEHASGTTQAMAAYTTATAGSFVMDLAYLAISNVTISSDTGMTVGPASTVGGSGVSTAYAIQAAAGSFPARTITMSNTNPGEMLTVALTAGAVGPPFGTNFGIPL